MNWGGPPFGVGVCPLDWPEGEALIVAQNRLVLKLSISNVSINRSS
jgi:hypothetical protein